MKSAWKSLSRKLRLPLHRRYAKQRLKEYHAEKRTLEEVIDWAMHFGGKGHMKVQTLQIPQEITQLAQAVQALQPKIILEIGTARGGTLLLWSYLASEEVIACDLNDMSVQAPVFTQFPPPNSKCKVTLLSGNSHESAFKQRVASALAGRRADFLFIDGDHTEGGVEDDYEDYKEFVRPGGLIAFHDIVEKQPLATNQVYHFWKRLKPQVEAREFVANPNQCGFGIGLVKVPETSN